MKKNLGKRLMACAMAISLLFGSTVYAAGTEESPADKPQVDNVGGTENNSDGVSISKTIAPIEGKENYFDITLKVTTPITKEDVYPMTDVVLVIDKSRSMYGEPLTRAKNAAKAFVDKFQSAEVLGEGSRLGVVAFDTSAKTYSPLTVVDTKAQAEDVKSLIGQIETAASNSSERYTNIEAGLKLASNLLAQPSNAKHKYIIFLTDGFPTTYIKSGTNSTSNIVGWNPKGTYDGLKGQTTPGDGYFYDSVFKMSCMGTSYSDTAAKKAQSMAASIKSSGMNIFCIGTGLGDMTIQNYIDQGIEKDGTIKYSIVERSSTKYVIGAANSTKAYKTWLENKIAGGKDLGTGNLYKDGDDLKALNTAYDNILKEIVEISLKEVKDSWFVADPMGEYVEFLHFYNEDGEAVSSVDGDNNKGAENTASYTDKINWTILDSGYTTSKSEDGKTTLYTYTLKYRVRLRNDVEGFVEGKAYETNGLTKFKYNLNVNGAITERPEMIFDVPAVEGFLQELHVKKLSSKEEGKVLANAEFTLTHKANCSGCGGDINIEAMKGVTDKEGNLVITRIPSGHDYTLTETKTPAHHEGTTETYDVIVSYDEVFVNGNGPIDTSKTPITVLNKYIEPTPISSGFQVNKKVEFEGSEITMEDTYNFEIVPVDGAPMPNAQEKMTAATDAQGLVKFNGFTWNYAQVGKTFVYEISEVEGDNPSIDYTDSVIYAAVTVGLDEESNTLTQTTTYYSDAELTQEVERPVFVNEYVKPVDGEAELTFFKRVEGNRELKAGEFTFEITAAEGTPMPEVTSVTNGEDGSFKFGPIVYEETVVTDMETYPKTYDYTVSEVAGNDSSFEYDSEPVRVIVEVNKNADNELVTEVSYVKGNTLADANKFVNIYTDPEKIEVPVTAVKELTGDRTALTADEFAFELTPVDGAPMPGNVEKLTAANAADGTVSFAENLVFTEDPGQDGKLVYEYQIKELESSNSSVEVDKAPVTVKVEVTKSNDNKLVADVTFEKSGEAVEAVVFENKYTSPEAVEVVLEAEKVLEGAELADGQFEFVLEAEEGTPLPETLTVKNDAEGKVVFPAITFTEDTENFFGKGGVEEYNYTYYIKETKGVDPSYVYDAQTVVAEVTITKNANNKLVADVVYEKTTGEKTNVFVNKYIKPDAATLDLNGTKTLAGHSIADGEFTFVLTPVDNAPGKVQEVTCLADGTFAFDTLVFEADEFADIEARATYSYEITEKAGSNPSYTYDSVPVKVNVTLKKTGADGVSKIEVDKVEYVKGEATAEGIAFENIYTAPEAVELILEAEKVLKKASLKEGQFSFELTPLNGAPGEAQTVTNAKDGSITFDPILVMESEEGFDWADGSESKVFEYSIKEVNDAQERVTYDESEYIAKVTVSKNADNQLVIDSITYTEDGEEVEAAEFVNAYRLLVKTGDGANIALWIALLVLSGLTIAEITLIKKRRRLSGRK